MTFPLVRQYVFFMRTSDAFIEKRWGVSKYAAAAAAVAAAAAAVAATNDDNGEGDVLRTHFHDKEVAITLYK